MVLELADLTELIETCLREVAADEGFALPPLEPDSELFGESGVLDSMALVALVTAVEEAIDRKANVTVSLVDERAMSQTRSPFRSIAALAEYARMRIDEAQANE